MVAELRVDENLYLVDHTDQEGINTRKNGQEGFQCLAKISTEELNREQINKIKQEYNNGRQNKKLLDRLLKEYGLEQRIQDSDYIDAQVRQSGSDNVGLAGETSKGESKSGVWSGDSQTNSKRRQVKTGWDGTNHPRNTDIEDVDHFVTPDGTLYGYATKDGRMVLDSSVIKPEHPLHEYTHLWDRVVAKENPELWKRGIELMKQFDDGKLWKQIADNEVYGKKWKEKGLTGTTLDYKIASEVHARLVGENGAKLLDSIAKKKGQKGIL